MKPLSVEDGMGDERTCECGHGRRCHWLRYIDEAGCYRPKECASKDCSCQQFKPGPRQATPFIRSAPATTEESPTFAYNLAMYLTRNGQQGNAPELQAGVEQFMRDKGSVEPATTPMAGRIMCAAHEWLDEKPCPYCAANKVESATEVRGKASPEMEELIGRLRESANRFEWPTVHAKDILKLLDHIEGKG